MGDILEEINKKTGRNDTTIAQAIANLDLGFIYRLTGYSAIRRVADYLYECWYDRIDYGMAFDYFKKDLVDFPIGGCSAVRKDNLVGRNFDWFYNKEAEFVVHTPAIGNRYASYGVACGADIFEEDAKAYKADKAYAILPFLLLDGVNSEGVFAEINVVPADEGSNVAYPAQESQVDLNAIMLVRYILDNFGSATDAVNFIKNHATVYFPKKLLNMHYKLHAMVCDGTDTFVLEFVDGETVIIEPDLPAITNFEINGVIFEQDNTVYTPETQDEDHDAIRTNGIHKYGSGLERWNIIAEKYSDLDEQSIEDLMENDLKYTSAYPTSSSPADPLWYTEFVGGDLTCASDPEDYTDILSKAGEEYTNRSRETATTWQTCHSAIYDISTKIIKLVPQESGVSYTFGM